jgi:phospholipid/cholesterol/gamma-HCH transport system substrate-binding protein
MQKQAPSLGRILTMVFFALSCFGLLLFLWLAFGGAVPLKTKGYRITVPFREAGQLATEADVRISGVSVGKVKLITPDKRTGLSDALIEMDRRYAPMPADTRAILRQKTLLGETYVELSPGSKDGPTVPDNGRLRAGQIAETVELDEIFRAFDSKTREAFRTWMQELAVAGLGRAQDINDALGQLAPFAQDATTLLKVLNQQEGDVRGVVRDTGTVFSALSERDQQLRSLISNSARVFSVTAARNRELRETFLALPTFERESRTTLTRLSKFARDTNPLVTQLRPAARQLSPALIELSALAPDLQSLFRDLDPLIDASEAGLPATEDFLDDLHPLLGELDPALRQLNPLLQYVGGYKRELTAFLANSTTSTQAKSPVDKIRYLRTTNPVNPEVLASYPRRIGANRSNSVTMPGAYTALAQGLASAETRQCGRVAAPGFETTGPGGTVSPELAGLITKFVYGGAAPAAVPAPPCRQQGPFTVAGETTSFPHVKAASGPTARSK